MSDILLNTHGVAVYLQVHEQQVYRLVHHKGLPGTWVKGKWVFLQSHVVQWVYEHVRPPASPAPFARRGKKRRTKGKFSRKLPDEKSRRS
jgi:Helix-turn-helix domain